MEVEREDNLRRHPPTRPYEPVSRLLRVPALALTATLDLLQRVGRRESGLFWYGQRDIDGNGTVAFVVAPRQRMSWGNYHVSPEALAEVVQRLPPNWKPLAQIHSHPGLWVEHSRYDDEMVSSRRALSIVFPLYGHAEAPFPTGVGVHEWQKDYWYLLTLEQASHRLAVFEGAVRVEDYR